MVADRVADMEVYKAKKKLADTDFDMGAKMEVDKVADMVAEKKRWPTWSWTWWSLWRKTR